MRSAALPARYGNCKTVLECRNPTVCRNSNAFFSLEPSVGISFTDSGVRATTRLVPEPAQDRNSEQNERIIKEGAVTAGEIPGNPCGDGRTKERGGEGRRLHGDGPGRSPH